MSSRDFVRTLPAGAGLSAQRPFNMLHLDPLLVLPLLAIIGYGLVILFSAIDRDVSVLNAQIARMGLALAVMVVAAQISPRVFLRWSPMFYLGGVLLLLAVLGFGTTVQGSTRWLDLPGLPRFQPSELMKLAVPLMIAWYLNDRPLPPRLRHLVLSLGLIAVPAVLIAVQPDLGTAILVSTAGLAVLVLSGLYWRWIGLSALAAVAAAPALWMAMHDYQRERVLTLFDPGRDPLGAGWNIIQSKTAIGSGGLFGKGLFEGTQSHLDFLPESQTDFIIAVVGEELGLVGIALLLGLYLLVVGRCVYIATQAPSTFGRLAVGAVTLTFFVYVFVNIAMVSGMLPVVGVPLPLVSYGGTSAITLLAGFGIVMSIHTHRTW